MVRDDVHVEDVQYGVGMVEVISITIRTSARERRKIIVAYAPPKTNAWGQEHKEMRKEVIKCLENMISKCSKVVLLEDFNRKGVNWKKMEVYGNAESWSEEPMPLVMENTMDQWVDEFTRYRGTEEPSVLDLVFTKRPELRPPIKYLSQMGKSDHIVIEVGIQDEKAKKRREDHKKGRLNYAKANFAELRKFFGTIEWKRIMKEMTVQDKYEKFLEKYKEGVQKYVPVYKVKESKYSWYNARCARAKKIKDTAWRKLKRYRNDNNREQYEEAGNEYVRIRREEEIRFEKDIVKCKEPKLFYRHIKGKMTNRETID